MALSIVYLDDEDQLCEIFKEFFQSATLSVHTFTSSAEAIAFCQNTPPDIAFVDYRLPDTTGIEVAKQLDAGIYKVLITGELNPPSETVFHEVMSKPYRLSDVNAFIDRYLAQK